MTRAFETYPNPPIQEAVLDIFVTLPEEIDVDGLGEFGKTVGGEFPDRKPRYRITSNISINNEDASKNSADASSTQIGWIFRTPNASKAVQARTDGFSFNRLPVYDGWGRFSGEAKRHWMGYSQIATPQFVTSISLRYINCILAPLPLDFRDYCLLFPTVPKNVPSTWSEFIMRFNGPSSQVKDGRSAVTVSFMPPLEKRAVLPLIVDVQVTQSFQAQPASAEVEIWDAFEKLRVEKNLVFESSITDKARQLFR